MAKATETAESFLKQFKVKFSDFASELVKELNITTVDELTDKWQEINQKIFVQFGLSESYYDEEILEKITIANRLVEKLQQNLFTEEDLSLKNTNFRSEKGYSKCLLKLAKEIKNKQFDSIVLKLIAHKVKNYKECVETSHCIDIDDADISGDIEEEILHKLDAEKAYDLYLSNRFNGRKAEIVDELIFASRTLKKSPFELAADKRFLIYIEKLDNQTI